MTLCWIIISTEIAHVHLHRRGQTPRPTSSSPLHLHLTYALLIGPGAPPALGPTGASLCRNSQEPLRPQTPANHDRQHLQLAKSLTPHKTPYSFESALFTMEINCTDARCRLQPHFRCARALCAWEPQRPAGPALTVFAGGYLFILSHSRNSLQIRRL